MIILCFQGCGKTCLADKSKGIIDLDCSIANRMCMGVKKRSEMACDVCRHITVSR